MNDEEKMRNEIKLTDSQIEDAFAEMGVFCDLEQLSFTGKTIEELESERASWSKPGHSRIDGTESCLEVLIISCAQITKEDPVIDLVIIDFGAARAIYNR